MLDDTNFLAKCAFIAFLGMVCGFIFYAIANAEATPTSTPTASHKPMPLTVIHPTLNHSETLPEYKDRATQAYIRELLDEISELRGEIVQMKVGPPPQQPPPGK